MRPFHGPRRLVLDTNNTEAAGGAESRRPSPPQSRSSTRGVGDETKFDSNMVIILAALLCALIFALGLNSIVRCALRCSRRLRLGSSRQPAAAAASRGLEKSKLRQIPVGVYRRSSIPSAAAATDCPICLGEFVDGDKVKVLPICGHGFHARCIDIWLSSHSSCPTCRHSLITELPMMTMTPPAPPSDDQNFRQLAPSGGHADFPEEVG